MALRLDPRIRVTEISQEGLRIADHPFDVERFEQIAKIWKSLEGDGDASRWACALEGVAKTGWSLSRSQDCRSLFFELIAIAQDLADGLSYFAPPTPPLIDTSLYPVDLTARYKTPANMVMTLVVDDSKLLLIKRSDSGAWSPPGGMCDPGLNAAENAAKEVEEESGVQVEITELLGVFDVMVRQPTECLYATVFKGEVTGGEPRIRDLESTSVGWFGVDEIPSELHMDGGNPWLDLARELLHGKTPKPYFDKARPAVLDLRTQS
jgi:ADP-ribose pyrophosphatase YjhB (NUDIX family)